VSGWYFVLGCLAGSIWTLAVTRGVRFPRVRIRLPFGRAQYVSVKVKLAANSTIKIQAIKEIRARTGLGLFEAKLASEGSPITLNRDVALVLAAKLRSLGAEVATEPRRKAAA
jgi:hypothetical protein